MKRLVPLAAGLFGLAACAGDPAAPLRPDEPARAAARETAAGIPFVILMKQSAVPADLAETVAAAGGRLAHVIPALGIAVAVASGPEFSTAIALDTRVAGVGLEPAAVLPELQSAALDAARSLQSPTAGDDLFNAGLVWGVQRVRAPAAWASGPAGTGEGAVVGIMDTGIASNHPDLAGNLVFNACYTIAGDVVGRAYLAGDPCVPYPSLSDHGTHVAGTVAAAFGAGRVVGVAPNAKLANYNVFERITTCGVCARASSRWRAMVHAADAGVDVINMSLGGFTVLGNDPKKFEVFDAEFVPSRQDGLALFLAAEKRVANYVSGRGTIMVSAAGNEGFDLNGSWLFTPGEVQGHITVGATGIRPQPRYQPGVSTDVRAFYSNFGTALDVAAPGGDCGLAGSCSASQRPANWFEYLVLSTIVSPAESCARRESCPTGYGWKAGTSMATPHVAGVAAILRAVSPTVSASQAQTTILGTAESLGSRQQFGHGMVNAAAVARGQ